MRGALGIAATGGASPDGRAPGVGATVQRGAARALAEAVEQRDRYTGAHCEAVVGLALAVAERLDLPERARQDVADVALLHDLGKLQVPDLILQKEGPLTGEEWAVMRRHPIASEALVSTIPALRRLAPAIRAEHERWDGGGYPDGLAGEEIPLSSRIVLVCDAFHAMTSDRPYRDALSTAVACAEIRRNAGTQFCPRSAGALLAVVARPAAALPAGTTVPFDR